MPINAKHLRQNQTKAEKILWYVLRDRRFRGLKFRRQVPFGPYIADFVCHERKLIIEVDGGQHADSGKRDRRRTKRFEREGYSVIRFWNNEVLENLDGVLQALTLHVK